MLEHENTIKHAKKKARGCKGRDGKPYTLLLTKANHPVEAWLGTSRALEPKVTTSCGRGLHRGSRHLGLHRLQFVDAHAELAGNRHVRQRPDMCHHRHHCPQCGLEPLAAEPGVIPPPQKTRQCSGMCRGQIVCVFARTCVSVCVSVCGCMSQGALKVEPRLKHVMIGR